MLIECFLPVRYCFYIYEAILTKFLPRKKRPRKFIQYFQFQFSLQKMVTFSNYLKKAFILIHRTLVNETFQILNVIRNICRMLKLKYSQITLDSVNQPLKFAAIGKKLVIVKQIRKKMLINKVEIVKLNYSCTFSSSLATIMSLLYL